MIKGNDTSPIKILVGIHCGLPQLLQLIRIYILGVILILSVFTIVILSVLLSTQQLWPKLCNFTIHLQNFFYNCYNLHEHPVIIAKKYAL